MSVNGAESCYSQLVTRRGANEHMEDGREESASLILNIGLHDSLSYSTLKLLVDCVLSYLELFFYVS